MRKPDFIEARIREDVRFAGTFATALAATSLFAILLFAVGSQMIS